MSDDERFHKNVELWSETAPKEALMLPYQTCEDLVFCKTEKGEVNLQNTRDKQFYHLQSGAAQEAEEWFKGLDLSHAAVLIVYGCGLGYYYDAAKKWLKLDPQRRLVFLEDDITVIHRLLEVPQGTSILQDPQVQLHYFRDLKDEEAIFELLYWNFSMQRFQVSALKYYEVNKSELYFQLCRKISYDFAMKNALVEEYLRFGGPFFVNFYRNMLSLPGSYLGNQTFGTFRKVPAIICGAGPSLAKSLPLLSTLLDKALIFAGGSALNALNAHEIQPHLGAGIDPNKAQFERLKGNKAFEVPFYYRNRMYHDAFKMIHGPRLYVTGSGGYDISDYFEEKLKIEYPFFDEGHNVVNFCLQIAHQLGCDPIIFIGLDLAFTGMKAYAPGVGEEEGFDLEKFKNAAEFDERPLLQKDIYGKPLYTLWKWIAEADWIGEFAKEHPEVTLINATEGGLGVSGIPNETLAEAAERYLSRSYPMRDRMQGEIQNSVMPGVTERKVSKLMKDLHESFKRCATYFDSLIEEAKRTAQTGEAHQSGQAALAEIELADEPAYQYGIDIFNQVQARLHNRELHELKNLNEKERQKKKGEINVKRLSFLKNLAKVNLEIMDEALKLNKEEKRIKIKQQKKKLNQDLPESPKKDFSFVMLPKKPAEGDIVDGKYIVTMLRKYGEPPEEIKMEYRGELEGQCLLYYPEGKLKQELFYRKGQLHGPATFYSEA